MHPVTRHQRVIVQLLLLLLSASSLDASGALLRYDVIEEQPVGTVVGSIRDAVMSGSNSSGVTPTGLQYSLSPSVNRYVNIDALTGLVRTSAVLDREQLCGTLYDSDCILDTNGINVMVQGDNNFAELYKMIIRLVDVNDHAPLFVSNMTSLNVSETSPPGTRLSVTPAEDVDSDQYGVTDYKLEPASMLRMFKIEFAVQPDGSQQVWLVLQQRLDRETQSTYTMTLVALDGGSPPKSASTAVIVNVLDVNDNKPRFSTDRYVAAISESSLVGTSVIQLSAADADDGLNGQIVYRWADDYETSAFVDLLGIERDTGLVYVAAPLDRELVAAVDMTVVASDLGVNHLSSKVRLHVDVLDENDNAPSVQINLAGGLRRGRVTEGRPGGGVFVGHVTASDPDADDNGTVTCRVDDDVGGRVSFQLIELQIESSSSMVGYQLVTADEASFDRETAARHQLTVTCSDGGSPALATSHVVEVLIDDVNDNSPVLSKSHYVFAVTENGPVPTAVGTIDCSDPDQGPNGTIQLRLEPLIETGNDVVRGRFAIDATTGALTTLASFDFETRYVYMFQVTAVDGGQPPRSASALVEVVVTDLNDERPVFESASYVFETPENQPVGTDIGRVVAVDRDRDPANRRVRYSVVTAVPTDALQSVELDASTGQLRVRRPLDREAVRELRLRIAAADTDQKTTDVTVTSSSSYCDVTVFVADVNDNAPVFVFPSADDHVLTLSADDIYPGVVVSRLSAIDADDNALTFNVVHSSTDDAAAAASRSFAVDPQTGLVSVVKYEPWRWQRQQQADAAAETVEIVYRVRLTVTVCDNGTPNLTAVAQLDVAIRAATTPSNLSRPADSDPGGLLDTQSLMVVAGGAALGATAVLLACIGLLCVTRIYCARMKARRVYNCRRNEVDRTPLGGSAAAAAGRRNEQQQLMDAGSRSKAKKGVTFDLHALDDGEESVRWREQPRISSPLQHSRDYCTINKCALHTFRGLRTSGHHGSEPTNVTAGNVWTTQSPATYHRLRLSDPLYQRRTMSLPFGGFAADDLDFDLDLDSPQRTSSLEKYPGKLVPNTGRWSTGSLTDSGRGHSEEDDVTTGLYVRSSDPPTPTVQSMVESHV